MLAGAKEWRKPTGGNLKCNIDAVVNKNCHIIGLGMIVRDNDGRLVGARNAMLIEGDDLFMAESICMYVCMYASIYIHVCMHAYNQKKSKLLAQQREYNNKLIIKTKQNCLFVVYCTNKQKQTKIFD